MVKSESQLAYFSKLPAHIQEERVLHRVARNQAASKKRAYAAFLKRIKVAHGLAKQMNDRFDKKRRKQNARIDQD
jgi:hypothetical protein